jgi:hypothetical protein
MEIKELFITKLNLEPGDTLFVKVKSDEVTSYALEALGEQLRETFPNNKVIVFGMGESDDIELTTVKDASYNDCSKPDSYCQDCSCGKKERAQNETDKAD